MTPHAAILARIRQAAAERHASHCGLKSSMPLSPTYELVGCLNEWGFFPFFGLPVSLIWERTGPVGDGGREALIPFLWGGMFFWKPVDGKGSTDARHLLVPAGKVNPGRIYVLGRVPATLDGPSELLGWATAERVAAQRPRWFGRYDNEGNELLTHSIEAGDLRPMSILRAKHVRARHGMGQWASSD